MGVTTRGFLVSSLLGQNHQLGLTPLMASSPEILVEGESQFWGGGTPIVDEEDTDYLVVLDRVVICTTEC